jgi:serine protease inhibitor
LSRSHFEFSVDLYRQLSHDFADKNLLFSPYSANAVLSMLFLGTSSFSNSSRQLRQALHLDNISYVDVHKSFKEIVRNLEDSYYKSMLQISNDVFYQVSRDQSWDQ